MDEFAKDPVKSSSCRSLCKRFGALWSRCVLPDAASRHREAYERLDRSYSDPRRQYHDWRHVARCLKHFDLAAPLMQDPDTVEIALWFHDAVYVPGASDNERHSAGLFADLASGQFPADLIAQVRELILHTAHRAPPEDGDGRLVVDIDLASLGSTWPRFLRDSDRIRNEFDGTPAPLFVAAQIGFLQALLARERIYYSDFFHRLCERRARRNVAKLIARLQDENDRGPNPPPASMTDGEL